MKKKLLTLMIGAVCAFGMIGCGAANNASGGSDASVEADSDAAYILKNGKMVIGITEYQPMNYYDANGELTGFDTEFAKAVCAQLGVDAEFQIIDWDTKETALKAKNIDCIWNGLTVTEERRANMDFSDVYLNNKQCVVINQSNASVYTDAASLSGAMISAESGSAGEDAISADASLSQASYTASASQADALLALKAGNYDAIVIDYTMAAASTGSGDYADLMIVEGIDLNDEQYAIGFRVGSDMTEKVNAIIKDMIADGTLAALAEKYELTELYNEAVK